jgi:hypothetical protein
MILITLGVLLILAAIVAAWGTPVPEPENDQNWPLG